MTNEELVAKIQDGDNSLQEQLWIQVEKWVSKLAHQFFVFHYDLCVTLSLDLDDFTQVGYFAMLDAIRAYKPDAGSKFNTILTWYVKNDFNTLAGLRGLYSKSKNSVKSIVAIRDTQSLDAPVSGDTDTDLTLADCLADPLSAKAMEQIENADYYEQLHTNLEKALNLLPIKQSACIRSYYYEGLTQQQIADALGVSETYVESCIRNGLAGLRRCSFLRAYRARQFNRAYKGGLNSWKQSGSSIQEQIVINLDEKERELMRYLEGL